MLESVERVTRYSQGSFQSISKQLSANTRAANKNRVAENNSCFKIFKDMMGTIPTPYCKRN
jgi:hypothetical protein